MIGAYLVATPSWPTTLHDAEARLSLHMGATARRIREPGFVAAYVPGSTPHGVSVARSGSLLALGQARLTNREDLERQVGHSRLSVPANSAGDLSLILRLISAQGLPSVRYARGVFAFVLWDDDTRTMTLVRDWLGMSRIFYSRTGGGVAAASESALLGNSERYDPQFAAHFLARAQAPVDRSIWAGVEPVGPGSCVTSSSGAISISSVSSLWSIEPTVEMSKEDAVEEFRALLDRAVARAVPHDGTGWAELSGGLDSSSIVLLSSRQKAEGGPGLRGTLTYVDNAVFSDPVEYIDSVTQVSGLPNHRFTDFSPWQDDGLPPPLTDEPRIHYVYWARERASRSLVLHSGSSVLLGGVGPDHYLAFRPSTADTVRGEGLWAGLLAAHTRAVRSQLSIWHYLWADGIRSLFTGTSGEAAPPSPVWLLVSPEPSSATEAFRCHVPMRDHAYRVRRLLYHIRSGLVLDPGPEALDRRQPFLDPDLITFTLGLRPHSGMRDAPPKWLLRDAMQGTLPETIRARSTKGTVMSAFIQALRQKRAMFQSIMREPLVSDLGWVDCHEMRNAIRLLREGHHQGIAQTLAVLNLETWLRVRSNRWPS